MKKLLSIFLLFWAAGAYGLDLNDLENFIEKSCKDLKVPGASVSIVQGDKVIYAKGFGLNKAGGANKVDEDTIFQLASVTKTFTSAGLGIQVDQGKTTWDREVIVHLPGFALKDPYPSRFATARDLLAHRTGLPAFKGDLLGKIGYRPEEILYRVRFIEPETSFRNKAYYSNVGYFVAGELLGKLAGGGWEEAVKKDLLEPLKMTRSGFSENLDNDNVAYPHALIDGQLVVLKWDRTGGFPAAGAVTSTAKDMGNWMILHLNEGKFEKKQILKPETVEEMHLPSMVGEASFSEMPPIDATSGFAFDLGWDSYHYEGQMIVEKGGGLDGIRTVVTLIPEMKMGITVLCNLNMTVLPELIRAKFLQMVLKQNDEKMLEEILSRQKKLSGLVKRPTPPKGVLPLSRNLADYTGTFENELYGTFTVKMEGDHLIVEAGPNYWKGTLTHWSNNTFLLSWPIVNQGTEFVTFTFGPKGRAIEFSTETLGRFSAAD